jgi:hypothetical protein
VNERRHEWRSMVTRAIDRGEVPPGTDAQVLLDLVRAIVDARGSSRRLNTTWLALAVRTVIAGARAGTLVCAANRSGNPEHITRRATRPRRGPRRDAALPGKSGTRLRRGATPGEDASSPA